MKNITEKYIGHLLTFPTGNPEINPLPIIDEKKSLILRQQHSKGTHIRKAIGFENDSPLIYAQKI